MPTRSRSLRVTLILPALTEATSPYWRPIKYSLFPPLGLATLAAYLDSGDEAVIVDEHVQRLDPDDRPDLVVIQVYITNAQRAYRIADHYRARGCFVALGGLHVTALPDEARAHADAIFLGPGEQTFPRFLTEFRAGVAAPIYRSTTGRSLERLPPIRRDLIDRRRYLVPNSIVVTRGCPQHCDFCYKDAFFTGGRSFYTQRVDDALAEIARLPGRHLYFLDDHLLGDARFAAALFNGMRGMNRLFQGAATVDSILRGDLIERAAEAGLRSLFVGFETLTPGNLARSHKFQNLGRDYTAVTDRLHALGIMINGSFVFGMDDDGDEVFERTVDWAIAHGITTATFHIQTPYPGTSLFARMEAEGRIVTRDWNLYDTRHVVFRPARLTPRALEDGYDWAYRAFYRWSAIGRAARSHGTMKHQAKHFFYAAGWKKFEPLWDAVIRARQLRRMTPLLEGVLSKLTGGHNRPPRIDGEPGDRAGDVDDRGDVKRQGPRVQAIDRPADHQRTNQPAEIAERVHQARDDAGMRRRDVEGRRPAGAERQIG
ncbi:MAG: radical SAM protein [Acidobacteriota bacterium]